MNLYIYQSFSFTMFRCEDLKLTSTLFFIDAKILKYNVCEMKYMNKLVILVILNDSMADHLC